MDSVTQVQVDVILKHPPISPLSLRERARVRGLCGLLEMLGIDRIPRVHIQLLPNIFKH